eukprot:TRINITY_DN348_c0_g1_i3.p2 TRINITY_DN348_c0_g1~~TRINITY_DN348_c0_g1_i3.p2  ORF type:complete len:156 (-),score=17.93 TRINITY_DN348_c0_g1_i3:762-1229(-)
MGFLDKLWDDTVAGPQPDKGLGRLRKENSFRERSSDGTEEEPACRMMDRRRSGDFQYRQDEARRVTQSIAISKPPLIQTQLDDATGSLPSTPVAQSPVSWSSPSPREKDNIWRSVFHPGSTNKMAMDRLGSAKFDRHTPNSPTVYDWVVISALDK